MAVEILHICKTADIEGAENRLKAAAALASPPPTVRMTMLGLWNVTQAATKFPKWVGKIRNMEVFCYYGLYVWSRKRKVSMNVPEMVSQWKVVVVTLCSAHDKAEIDRAEFKMDELLTPMLSAPVKELREFYCGLTEALRADPAVPFFIWSMFSAYGEIVVKDAEDKEKRHKLKRKLAETIADMAEERIDRKDITAALVGALMWRDPATLENIKGDLEAGAKPRLRGRESCLFMVTQRDKKSPEHLVML